MVKISKSIHISNPEFIEVLHAEKEIRYRCQDCSRLKLPRQKTTKYDSLQYSY